MKKFNKLKKLISLLLVVVMVSGLTSGYAPADKTSINEVIDNIQSNIDDIKDKVEDKLEEVIDEFKLPDIIDKLEAKVNGYIGRIESEEKDLYTFMFLNEDGTQTMRLFSHPVKYIDKLGDTKDISLDIIKNSNGGYETVANSIYTEFSKYITEGIKLKYEDVDITMFPSDINISNKEDHKVSIMEDEKTVEYTYDDKTTYEYSLTYTGFKEDIVVSEYTGQTEYTFTIKTNGLKLVEEFGSYYLADKNGEARATIGDIIIFTADERNNTFGSMTYEVIEENEEYEITIHIDADYLQDEKTVYPIKIDPTIEINYDNNGAGAIEDITINSVDPLSGTSGSIGIGRFSDNSISRILMRFPNLSLKGISSSNITSARVEIRDLMCQSNEDVTVECCFLNASVSSWTEASNPRWEMLKSVDVGDSMDSHIISYGKGNVSSHRYGFDITYAVKKWANNISSPQKGIIFKAVDSFENQTGSSIQYYYKTFASYNRASNKPSFTLTYKGAITLNASTINVQENGGKDTLIATTTPTGQSVTWKSSDESVATVSGGVVTGKKAGKATITASFTDSDGNVCSTTCTAYVYKANGVYYIENMNSNLLLGVDTYISDTNNQVIQKSVNGSATDDYYKICQMWKINYIGYGKYTVRPMRKLDQGLNYSNINVRVGSIGATETTETTSSVTSNGQWVIEWKNNGYRFCGGGDISKTLQISGSSETIGTHAIVYSYNEEDNCKWNLTKISSPPAGILLYNKNDIRKIYVPKKETKTISELGISVCTYSSETNSQEISWSSSDESIAWVNASNGTVTGIKEGNVTITAKYTTPQMEYSTSYKLEIISFSDINVFIKNSDSNRFLQIDNGNANGSISDAIMEQWTFNGEEEQQWNLVSLNNGYYKIVSQESKLVLAIPEGKETTDGANVVQQSYTGLTRQQWKIIPAESGYYRIQSRAAYEAGKNLVLTVDSSLIEEGSNIKQRTYNNNKNYRYEWYIREVVYAYSVGGEFYNGDDVRSAHCSWITCGYSSSYDIDPSMESLDENKLNKEIVYFSGHGGQHSFAIHNNIHWIDGYVIYKKNNVWITGMNLTNAKLYIYDGCLTASLDDGTGTNLCISTVTAGVDCVIGWTETINSGDSQVWQDRFQDRLIAGDSVLEAANYANSFIYYENSAMKSWRIYGDENIIISEDTNMGLETESNIEEYDDKILCTKIKFDRYDRRAVEDILAERFESFSVYNAGVMITYTNETETDYVIDYVYTYNGYSVCSGYTLIVQDGYITYIRDNVSTEVNAVSRCADIQIPELTQEIIAQAHSQAEAEVYNISEQYQVVEHRGEKFYDVSQGKYYYRIVTVYQTVEGCYGTNLTLYEL